MNLRGLKIDDCDDDSDDDSEAKSLRPGGRKIDSTPGAKAAVQSAGMTTREYVVFTFSLMQNGLAAWAVDQPGGKLPPGVSQANVDFIRAHKGDWKKWVKSSDDSNCDDGGEDENGE